MTKPAGEQSMRVDKWLWCARFFKTRGLATEAIKGGKVMVDGRRCKPARTIAVGNHLVIRRGAFEYALTVKALGNSRKSARDAARLYEESAESMEKRELLAEQIKLNASTSPQTRGRPTKKERRELLRFRKHNQDDS